MPAFHLVACASCLGAMYSRQEDVNVPLAGGKYDAGIRNT